MAFLVLFSTVSFTLEQHFCGDTLVDSAVFTKVQGCDTDLQSAPKKLCCKDDIEVIKGQDNLKLTTDSDFVIHQSDVINSSFNYYFAISEPIEKKNIPHKDYSPPNLVTDIQVLDQVFTI